MGEVRKYKTAWEIRCREATQDEVESPIEEVHETKLIDGNGHETYQFDMGRGDELVFSIEANDYLDAVICEEADVEEWTEGEFDEESPLPDEYWWFRRRVKEGNYRFTAPQDGRYVLLLVNWDEDETEITVDADVWEAE